MNSLIACLPSDVTAEAVRDQLLARGISADLRDGRIVVSHEESIAWVEPDLQGELAREYEPDELALIGGLIGKWNGFGIDYRTIEAADVVVAVMCERWPCVVDDDDEFIGWGANYLERRRSFKG
ncbi:hypothetical protein [Streptomyces longisporus]